MIDLRKHTDTPKRPPSHACCPMCTDLDRALAHKRLREWNHAPKSAEPNPIPTLPNVTFSFE